MATKVIMPQLGESVVEGTVTKWLRGVGEHIDEFEALVEINTDKVDTEVPSPASGTILKILVPDGATVRAGTALAWIGAPEEQLPDEAGPSTGEPQRAREEVSGANASSAQDSSLAETRPVAVRQPGRDHDLGFISPVVARIAREKNVDLSQVKGTGREGRITKADILAYLDQQANRPAPEAAAWETPADGDLFRPTEMVFGPGKEQAAREKPPLEEPAPAATPRSTPANRPEPAAPPAIGETGQLPGTVIPLNPVRRTIAERMVQSKHLSPHVTTVMEADMSRVAQHRAENLERFTRDGVKLTYSAYFVAAAVAALKAFPLVNSSWTEEGIRMHRPLNIGLATSLGDEGLIVPVIKGADGFSLFGLARAINDLAERARAHRLQPEEVKGGTFTITNHGVTGSLMATPIIFQPQCAILGVGAVQKRVVVIHDAIAIRPMVYLTLTFDHRILDGAAGDHFLAKVVETLENWSSG